MVLGIIVKIRIIKFMYAILVCVRCRLNKRLVTTLFICNTEKFKKVYYEPIHNN